MPRNVRLPELDYPPVQASRFASTAFSAGIDTATVDGTKAQVHSAETSLADCFKFRSKVHQDVALEALQLCGTRKRAGPAAVLKYARIAALSW